MNKLGRCIKNPDLKLVKRFQRAIGRAIHFGVQKEQIISAIETIVHDRPFVGKQLNKNMFIVFIHRLNPEERLEEY